MEASPFEEFVAARSPALLRTAFLLTRDHALADDLLQTAFAKVWSHWSKIAGDPEPYVRRALVNTYTSWWRRKWRGEVPTDDMPEVPISNGYRQIDDRDVLRHALRRLPPRQRAVVVLRYFEDLSEAETARAFPERQGGGRLVGSVLNEPDRGRLVWQTTLDSTEDVSAYVFCRLPAKYLRPSMPTVVVVGSIGGDVVSRASCVDRGEPVSAAMLFGNPSRPLAQLGYRPGERLAISVVLRQAGLNVEISAADLGLAFYADVETVSHVQS